MFKISFHTQLTEKSLNVQNYIIKVRVFPPYPWDTLSEFQNGFTTDRATDEHTLKKYIYTARLITSSFLEVGKNSLGHIKT